MLDRFSNMFIVFFWILGWFNDLWGLLDWPSMLNTKLLITVTLLLLLTNMLWLSCILHSSFYFDTAANEIWFLI